MDATARAQRKALLTLELALARELHALWQAHVHNGPLAALLARLIRAYADELAAVREEMDGDPRATVSPLWIATNVEPVIRRAHTTFADYAAAALYAVTHAQGTALHRGTSDAEALVRASLATELRHLARSGNPAAVAAFHGYSAHGRGNDGGGETPLARLFDRIGPDAAARLRRLLLAGLSSGSHPSVVAGWIEDALGWPRNRALLIARTEMLGAYRIAATATYRANADVLDGWVWLATDDARTCAFCLSMNGTLHPLDEDMSGTHPNCRCTQQPKTKSTAAILADLGLTSA